MNSKRAWLDIFSFAALGAYIFLFAKSLSPAWFNPEYLTDDALQQSYPFHKIYHPGIFDGDLITEAMEGYLAPLHYWLHYGITYLTASPILTGHYVMLIQITLAALFIFLAVTSLSNRVVGCFSVLWFFHSRNLVLAMTGGLTRGWASVVTAAFLCFALRKSHYGVLLTLFLGCMLHPPATIVAASCYGLYLLSNFLLNRSSESKQKLKTLIFLSPLCILTTLYVVHRPDHIGQMISKEAALVSPSYENPGGRFAFLPLPSISTELRQFGLRPFVNNFYSPPGFIAQTMPFIVFLLVGAYFFRRKLTPSLLWFYALALFGTYFLARELIFKLYVPDRYLQGPLGVWLIILLTSSTANFVGKFELNKKNFLLSAFAACVLAFFLSQSFLPKTIQTCLLYTSPSPRDATLSRMPCSA